MSPFYICLDYKLCGRALTLYLLCIPEARNRVAVYNKLITDKTRVVLCTRKKIYLTLLVPTQFYIQCKQHKEHKGCEFLLAANGWHTSG